MTVSEASLWLSQISESLHRTQQEITPELQAFAESGKILPAPIERWQDANNFMLARNLRQLRRHLQTGRNQIETRDLIDRAEKLKEVWDAYRSATAE